METQFSFTKTLSSGFSMPIIGLGTYLTKGHDDIYNALSAALTAGYRAIDTAGIYGNEAEIGQCLKSLLIEHGLERKDIHVTSKLWAEHQGQGKCRAACLQSLADLQLDYLDLYLIHWPGVIGLKSDDPRQRSLRAESWRDMEDLVREGKIRSIGVSNYLVPHLEELLSTCDIKPAVLQSEFHPHLTQTEVISLCRSHDVTFQAYSSLGTSDKDRQLLNDPCVGKIANLCKKSPAQVLLRWAVQQNIGVLPKSTNPDHIKSNIDIFDFKLTDEQMSELSGLDIGKHYTWNPEGIL